jgi:hypothetical protein
VKRPSFPTLVSNQLRHEFSAVDAIGLRLPHPPVRFDRARIDDDIVDPQLHQRPVQTKSITAGLVATVH